MLAHVRRLGDARLAPVVAVAAVAAVVGALHGGFTDLNVYQHGGRALLDGGSPYAGREPVGDLPFTYPPFAAVAMAPLAWLPAWLLAALWTAASGAALVGVITLVARELGWPADDWWPALAALGAVLLEPVWQNLAFGQVNLLLMLAVLVDVLRPQRRWSGVLVGIAAGVKLTPLVFVVFLALVGARSTAARAVAAFGGTALVGAVFLPGASADNWGDDLVRAGRVGPPALVHNQSVYGALTRLLDGPPSTLGWLLAAGPLSLAVLAVGVAWWRRGDRALGGCLAAMAMLLASPVSWSHHWVWAVPVTLVLWARHRWLAAAWAAVFAARPILWPPWGDGREYGWSPLQHVVGNAYLLAALAFAGWAAVELARIPARAAPAPTVGAHP